MGEGLVLHLCRYGLPVRRVRDASPLFICPPCNNAAQARGGGG
jgi:hypothetical protein